MSLQDYGGALELRPEISVACLGAVALISVACLCVA